jgi:hypothetical protein
MAGASAALVGPALLQAASKAGTATASDIM